MNQFEKGHLLCSPLPLKSRICNHVPLCFANVGTCINIFLETFYLCLDFGVGFFLQVIEDHLKKLLRCIRKHIFMILVP